MIGARRSRRSHRAVHPRAPSGAVAHYSFNTLISIMSRDSARIASRAPCGGALSRWMRATAAAAPFAKGRPTDQPKKSGRKPGKDYGRKAHRQPPSPEQIDEVHEAPLPHVCPD